MYRTSIKKEVHKYADTSKRYNVGSSESSVIGVIVEFKWIITAFLQIKKDSRGSTFSGNSALPSQRSHGLIYATYYDAGLVLMTV